MGSVNRLDYTVLGERVNLASRLCDTADRGEILIDETTRQGLGDQATTELVENLSLKGFSAEIQAWRLKGYSPLA
jgi:class 3 adenylate cyclase